MIVSERGAQPNKEQLSEELRTQKRMLTFGCLRGAISAGAGEVRVLVFAASAAAAAATATAAAVARSPPSTSQRGSPPNEQVLVATLAARLTTKQADNDALFRCNHVRLLAAASQHSHLHLCVQELAHANVTLHEQVEQLQYTVRRVSDELESLSSSRHSSESLSRSGAAAADERGPTTIADAQPDATRESNAAATLEQLQDDVIVEAAAVEETPPPLPVVEKTLDATLKRKAQGRAAREVARHVVRERGAVATSTQLSIKSSAVRKAKPQRVQPRKATPPPPPPQLSSPPPPEPQEQADENWGWGDDDDEPTNDAPRDSTPPPRQTVAVTPSALKPKTALKSSSANEPRDDVEPESWGWDDDESEANDMTVAESHQPPSPAPPPPPARALDALSSAPPRPAASNAPPQSASGASFFGRFVDKAINMAWGDDEANGLQQLQPSTSTLPPEPRPPAARPPPLKAQPAAARFASPAPQPPPPPPDDDNYGLRAEFADNKPREAADDAWNDDW